MTRSVTLLALSMMLLASCRPEGLVTAPTAPRVVAPTAIAPFMALSTLAPSVGDTITIDVDVTQGAATKTIGSFMARIVYDTAALTFVGRGDDNTDGSFAVNSVGGVVLAAGASGSGFSHGHLASARMLVRDPAGLASLDLSMSELTAVDFGDQRPAMIVSKTLYRSRR